MLYELKKISKLLIFAYSDKIMGELEKIATTNERKMIWVLIDGKRNTKEISDRINVSHRSVQRFQKLLDKAGLATNPWGKPALKIFDYVPPEWIELLPPENETVEMRDEIENE